MQAPMTESKSTRLLCKDHTTIFEGSGAHLEAPGSHPALPVSLDDGSRERESPGEQSMP